MALDIALFRKLAFKKEPADHPISTEAEAKAIIAGMAGLEPGRALAELVHWAASISEHDGFSAGARARVLLQLDAAAHDLWRPLGHDYLAPNGRPTPGTDGNAAIILALQESAAAFARGFDLCLSPEALESRWVRANALPLAIRRMRWHTRDMTLAHMLHLPGNEERWAQLHRQYHFALERNILRTATSVFSGDSKASSLRQEYLRPILAELARIDRLPGRGIELVYRLVSRISSSVKTESEPSASALYAVVPEGSERPVTLKWHAQALPASAIYIDLGNALPRLKSYLERDLGTDPGEPDPLLGGLFTVGERRAMAQLLLDNWAAAPPKRRAQRIAMKSQVVVINGFAALADMVPRAAQGDVEATARHRLRIEFDRPKEAAQAPKAAATVTGEVYDASTSGLGIELERRNAKWARLGSLLAMRIAASGERMAESGDWLVGAVRRINPGSDSMRLGIEVLSRKPSVLWFQPEDINYVSVWEHEKVFDRNFGERYRRALLLDTRHLPLTAGQMILAPHSATLGTRLELPLADGGTQPLAVARVIEDNDDFLRVAFTPLN